MTEPLDPSLAEVEKNWNEFGKRDPLWAILTHESKRDNKWDLVEFFATGEREIGGVIKDIEQLHPSLPRGKALDFGCGVGRLTQALCRHFEECHGLDIAESMVEKARQYNRYGARCQYHVNTRPDLSLFAGNTFDFIYTNIVLQHNPPAMSRRFIREFLRILTPGGLLMFQLPSEPLQSHHGQGSPLKTTAFHAQLTLAGGGLPWVAGTIRQVSITVKNISPETWPGKAVSGSFPVRLGNHWRNAKNRILINDDPRPTCPATSSPVMKSPSTSMLPSPAFPANTALSWTWSRRRWRGSGMIDSPTLMLDVEVVPNPQANTPRAGCHRRIERLVRGQPAGGSRCGTNPGQARGSGSRMEMNGIPKPEMLAFLAEINATVLQGHQ